MVRIPGFHCIARGSIPGWRTESLASHTAQPKQKEGRKDERKKERNCSYKNSHRRNFPGGPGVENSLCNAGDAGSILGQGTKIPHATKDPT